jgi:hypothetical protein
MDRRWTPIDPEIRPKKIKRKEKKQKTTKRGFFYDALSDASSRCPCLLIKKLKSNGRDNGNWTASLHTDSNLTEKNGF